MCLEIKAVIFRGRVGDVCGFLWNISAKKDDKAKWQNINNWYVQHLDVGVHYTKARVFIVIYSLLFYMFEIFHNKK